MWGALKSLGRATQKAPEKGVATRIDSFRWAVFFGGGPDHHGTSDQTSHCSVALVFERPWLKKVEPFFGPIGNKDRNLRGPSP